jgi:hypothetical protein
MVSKLVPKINYPVLVQTAKGIGVNVDGLPEELPMDWRENEGFLKKVSGLGSLGVNAVH